MQATLIKVKNKPYQKQTCTMIVNICDGKKTLAQKCSFPENLSKHFGDLWLSPK